MNIQKNKPTKNKRVKQQNTSNSSKSRKAIKGKSKYIDFKEKQKKGDPLPKFNDNAIRLNKYLSNAGICSRREADVLIQTGVVTVNDTIVTELGFKVALTDVVKYDGHTIRPETKRYVLLNKPKGFSCSSTNPQEQKTVFALIKKACKEQILPIGRLEKESTGLLLCTNDSDLAKKLTHPQHRARQIYEVELDKPMSTQDVEKLVSGIELEDGTSRFDHVEFIHNTTKNIGIELKNSKHQIVRRTLEALGYKVVKLDRTAYAGLTKKDLPRGYIRHLTPQEVTFLKMS